MKTISGEPKNPRLIGLCMLQDEADIIEYTVRANLLFLNHIVLVAQPSSDGSLDILDALVGEGLPITIWRRPVNLYAQTYVLTSIAARVQDAFAPDFLFMLDADEILRARRREDLVDNLSQIPPGNVGVVPWKTFITPEVTPDPRSGFDPAKWIEALAEEPQQYYKIVIPADVIARLTRISTGSHAISSITGEMIPSVKLESVFLAHLPVRTGTQLVHKIINSIVASAIARGTNWWGSELGHYTSFLDEMVRTGGLDDVRRASLTYALTDKDVPLPGTTVLETAYRLPLLEQKYDALRTAIPSRASLFGRLISNIRPLPGILQNRPVAVQSEKLDFSASGAFSAEFHSRILKCDWPPIDFAENRIRPDSVLDIGCGLGPYLAVLRSRGKSVFGVDGSDHGPLHLIPDDAYLKADLTDTSVAIPGSFDMGICLETLEHLPFAAGVRVVELLSRQCQKAIVFSVAQPRQPGYNHITLLDVGRWLEEFVKRGWHVDCQASLSMRFLASYHWFRKNLFLLLPGPPDEDCMQALADLLQIGKQVGEWPGQADASVASWPGELRTFAIRSKDVFEPLETATRDMDSMRREIDQLRDHLSTATEKLAQSKLVEAKVHRLEAEIEHLKLDQLDVRRECQSIKASLSWRITRPMRMLRDAGMVFLYKTRRLIR